VIPPIVRAVSLIVVVVLTLGGVCARDAAAASCCASTSAAPAAAARIGRACCCQDPGDQDAGRPAELRGVRPAEHAAADSPVAIAAPWTPPPRHPDARPLTFSLYAAIPPPTLLHARTAFLC
jgi:hypothetical protein